ncbi:MAG: peptidoglycan/xylan/chitin deacetylase (PgdA/CDA1 family) [Luteibaculaceae bacterium]|jgi:peptidoglycan/xylan/chitin deacetylase (PgdA/CDA1 family)
MAGFRDQFINRVSKGAGVFSTSLLQKVSNQRLILPFYHTISDDAMPHVQHLYPVKGVKAFVQDLDFLLKYYTPIDYPDFLELTRTNSQAKKPSFLLSFDDGLKEFHDVIAPILLQKGIPAICFLNSDFIDNKDIFYRYKSSLLIDVIKKNPSLNSRIEKHFKGANFSLENILSITYQNKEILMELANLVEYDFNEFLVKESPYLSSNQIKSLIKQGFYFGSHSLDHPEYQYVDLQEQVRQTKESIQNICTDFSIDYKIFSFPFTDYKVSRKFFNQINENNIAENTFGCAGQKKDMAPNNFQRIPFEMKHLTGRQILNSELLYYLLKIPFGKNTIHRNG